MVWGAMALWVLRMRSGVMVVMSALRGCVG
jgi:hypothetical protein